MTISSEPRQEPAESLPLCVDLDGTLVRGDTLHEQLLRALITRPLAALMLFRELPRGKAAFKRRLAAISPVDPASLPYQPDFLDYLHGERALGRTLILVTAADASVADAVAAHVGLFDEAMGSDGVHNLASTAKAERLAARFGAGGFAYAGNAQADLAVWERAGEVLLVNAPAAIEARMARPARVTGRFGARPGRLRALLKAMRVYQWVKNLLVFLPMLLGHALGKAGVVTASLLVFLAFSLTASGIYIVNDLLDLQADRAHPRKRRRPFASGDLPITFGVAGPILVVLGLSIAWVALPLQTIGMLVGYVLLTSWYSAHLKKRPLVDVFTLAGLYTLRVLTGAVATRIEVSIWLLGFSLFVFLSLAFLKRSSELAGTARAARGYQVDDLALVQIMGVASAFMSAMVLSLYLGSDTARALYVEPAWLWVVVPLELFALCRLWLAAGRGYMTDDPIVFAAKDRVCWLALAGIAAAFVLATTGPEIQIR